MIALAEFRHQICSEDVFQGCPHFGVSSTVTQPGLLQIAAFSNELAYTFGKATDMPKNVISVGDSVHERAALQKVRLHSRHQRDTLCSCHTGDGNAMSTPFFLLQVTAGIPSVLAKSLKLVERPTIGAFFACSPLCLGTDFGPTCAQCAFACRATSAPA